VRPKLFSGLVAGGAFLTASAFVGVSGAKSLFAEPMHGEKIRIDGDLREWSAKMTDLTETVKGSASAADPKAGVTLGYDDTTLYVVLRVTDNKLVRTAAAGAAEDHATLYLSFPKGNSYQVDFYPGAPGKSAGVVKMKGQKVAGSKLVEAPTDKGYTIEATLPWSTFSEAARVRVGLRAAVRLTDSDAAGSVKAVIATGAGQSGRALPPLLLSVEQGLDKLLVRDKGLSSTPAREVFGNVSGDGLLERVAVFGPYLTIVGPAFRGGKEFYFGELGVESASMGQMSRP
jgi:hypothetical protein